MKKRLWLKWLAACTSVIMLSGCTVGNPLSEPSSDQESSKLRVMYPDKDQFYLEYGGYFAMEHPEIEIEVIETDPLLMDGGDLVDPAGEDSEEGRVLEFIDQEQPDIMMTDLMTMKRLAELGRLYDMDAIMKQERYNLDDMLPGLIDMLREQGGGGLYALAPAYNTKVLFYNADLFHKYGIELPTNQMSWKELLQLGERFVYIESEEGQLYGIANPYNDRSELMSSIIQGSNLQLIDARGENALVNTQSWRDLFQMTASAVSSGAIRFTEHKSGDSGKDSVYDSDFMQGKAAMLIEDSRMINTLENASLLNKGSVPFNWGVVTMPVDPSYPHESAYITTETVFSINQASEHKAAAWELMKFIHSPEMAKTSTKMINGQLPTRITYLNEMNEDYAKVLTMLKPKTVNSLAQTLDKYQISYPTYKEMYELMNQALDDLIAGKLIPEVIPMLQNQLQQVLDQANAIGS
ncbi:ABC transporter substrate-binding protein [Paenibacillus marinisediminis]